MSVTFSSRLFAPSPALYAGVGSSGGLVPHVYDVEIGGRPYMIDLGSDAYIVALEQRLRDSVDQGNVPGENSISSQGLWRRAQDTWHLGAGQYWADTQESQYGRFWTSVGVDPFTVKGELKLLKRCFTQYSDAADNPFMVRANGRLYFAADDELSFITSLGIAGSFPTSVTGLDPVPITGLASDGYHVFVTQGDEGVFITNAGVTTAAAYVTGIECGPIGYVKGRLMVGGTGADQGHLWNFTHALNTSVNNPTAFYIHPNNSFEWVAFAEGPNHIYCAGHNGAESLIYRTQVKPDGTALDVPVVAGTLPMGEVVTAMYGYLGFLFIGTNKGVRMATVDQNGDLVFGAVIPTGSNVNCFAGNDRFVFFGWSNHPSGFAGAGCIDLAYLTASNTPAYCSWVYREGTAASGEVTFDIEVFENKIVLGVAKLGIVRETGYPLLEGYLETGAWTYGIPDKKIVAKIDGRHDPLLQTDTVRIAIKVDNGEWIDCGCVAPAGSPLTLFNPRQTPGYKIEGKIVLKAQTYLTSPSIPPPDVNIALSAFNRVNFRAYVNPERSLVLQVPVLLHPRLEVEGGDNNMDVLYELSHLRRLATEAQITVYTDSMLSVRCIVEDVRWVPDNNRESIDRKWAGTALVTMRTVDEV
jgi:hypothetical protein